MNNLPALVVDVDAVVKVEPASFHVPGHAVTRLQERHACDCVGRHFDALRVKDLVDAVSKVKKVARH